MFPQSWIIERIDISQPVFETWSKSIADACKAPSSGYRVWSAHDWLVELNRRIKADEVEA